MTPDLPTIKDITMSAKRKASRISGDDEDNSEQQSPSATTPNTPTATTARIGTISQTSTSLSEMVVDLCDEEPKVSNSTDGVTIVDLTSDVEQPSEPEYEVEKILQKRSRKGKIQYYVKWLGFSEAECTWEPEENLGGAEKAIEAFVNDEKSKKQAIQATASSQKPKVSKPVGKGTGPNAPRSRPAKTAKPKVSPLTESEQAEAKRWNPEFEALMNQLGANGNKDINDKAALVIYMAPLQDYILVDTDKVQAGLIIGHRFSTQHEVEFLTRWGPKSQTESQFSKVAWFTEKRLSQLDYTSPIFMYQLRYGHPSRWTLPIQAQLPRIGPARHPDAPISQEERVRMNRRIPEDVQTIMQGVRDGSCFLVKFRKSNLLVLELFQDLGPVHHVVKRYAESVHIVTPQCDGICCAHQEIPRRTKRSDVPVPRESSRTDKMPILQSLSSAVGSAAIALSGRTSLNNTTQQHDNPWMGYDGSRYVNTSFTDITRTFDPPSLKRIPAVRADHSASQQQSPPNTYLLVPSDR